MDNVDAALKSSFRKDVSVGLSSDEFLSVNSENVNFPEDFSVDELFDFSGDVEPTGEDEEEQETEQVPVVKRQVSDESSNFSSGDDSMSFPTATDLVVPLEDLAELEWLSNFVEDSFPESYAGEIFPAKPHWSSLSAQKSTTAAPPAENPSTTKIRSKRRRSQTHNRFFTKPVEPVKLMETNGPAVKRQKRRKQKCEGRQTPRRCGHCGVQKTPQWREGPTGAKTLCNACGVRFKSGRLLPEYRPACSPTFSSELHSNSHRKVLEMRRQKEMSSGRVEPSLILPGCA